MDVMDAAIVDVDASLAAVEVTSRLIDAIVLSEELKTFDRQCVQHTIDHIIRKVLDNSECYYSDGESTYMLEYDEDTGFGLDYEEDMGQDWDANGHGDEYVYEYGSSGIKKHNGDKGGIGGGFVDGGVGHGNKDGYSMESEKDPASNSDSISVVSKLSDNDVHLDDEDEDDGVDVALGLLQNIQSRRLQTFHR